MNGNGNEKCGGGLVKERKENEGEVVWVGYDEVKEPGDDGDRDGNVFVWLFRANWELCPAPGFNKNTRPLSAQVPPLSTK